MSSYPSSHSKQTQNSPKRRNRVPILAALVLLVALVGQALLPYIGKLINTNKPVQELPQELEAYLWNEQDAPAYVQEFGAAQIEQELNPGEIVYGELDELGRASQVNACLTHQMVVDSYTDEQGTDTATSSLERLELKPSGWGNNERVSIVCPDGHTYRGWFWNRSHLLADSLGGDVVIENLICGTRMQNVGSNDGEGGMGWCESRARNWLWKHTSGYLEFCATPIYFGNELVARAVVVDMRSSDGEIDSRVIVFNAAKGFDINYEDGSFTASA